MAGNDFELNSVIENIAISSDNGHIRLSNLPEYLFSERPGGDSASSLLPASLTFSAIEKEAIHAARVTSGRVQEMSQLLNIGRTTLWRKMKQYDIDASQFKRKHQACLLDTRHGEQGIRQAIAVAFERVAQRMRAVHGRQQAFEPTGLVRATQLGRGEIPPGITNCLTGRSRPLRSISRSGGDLLFADRLAQAGQAPRIAGQFSPSTNSVC